MEDTIESPPATDGPNRILIVHNSYLQRGGEDGVVESEAELLQHHGHQVRLYARSNAEIVHSSKPAVFASTIWSSRSLRDIGRIITTFAPDVIHVHNTFPLISPSAFWAGARAGIPVVMTVHNFRLFCLSAVFLRDAKVCQDCLGHLPWRGVVHRCYHHSVIQSATVAAMLTAHRAVGTWRKTVARFIVLNEFSRMVLVAGGVPRERIAIKPNFADAPPLVEGVRRGGLFVGRLSVEKGCSVLAQAAARLNGVVIDVIGAGPEEVVLAASKVLRLHGARAAHDVRAAMLEAAYVVVPSICYEVFPLVVVEAFASGAPVIASRLGGLAELVEDGRTGLLFTPGDAGDLAEKIAWAESNPAAVRAMGRAARREYEMRFSSRQNYDALMRVYVEATTVGRELY